MKLTPPSLFRHFLALLAISPGLWTGGAVFAAGKFGTETAFRIPITVDGVTRSATPAYVGVPFPKGWKVRPESVSVVDGEGKAVPSNAWKMVNWPEQESIRWMGVDFVASPGASYYVVPDRQRLSTPLTVRKEEGRLVVDTGVARFVIPEREGALISEAYFDANGDGRFDPAEKRVENTQGDDLYLIDQKGREAIIGDSPGRVEIETEGAGESGGPVRLVIRRGGNYRTPEGVQLGRYVTRMHFFAGQAQVRIEHSLIVTEDTNQTWIRDYGLRFRPATALSTALFPSAGEELKTSLEGGEVFLFQEKAFHFDAMDEQKDCRYVIGRGSGETLREGTLAGDWVIAGDAQGVGIGVSLPQLWQQFPKELSVSPDVVTVRLWSARGGRELDFRAPEMAKSWPQDWLKRYAEWGAKAVKDKTSAAGIARTHTLYLDLNPQPEALSAASQTVLCLVDPYWLRETEAMGAFHPYDPARFPEEEAWMERWYDQWTAVTREWGQYGFFDYGAAPHTWYRRHPETKRWEPYLTRYGMDYGFHSNLWRMVVRGNGRKYFDDANRMTRHWVDFRMQHNEPHRGLNRNAAYTPRFWAAAPSFHYQSGTDIRKLAYLYYFTDYRPAREMLDHYARTLKQLWERGDRGVLRASRPFAVLKNIATIYQETGDPVFREIMDDQTEWLVDLNVPQGVKREAEATGLAKYSVKMGAMQRAYEVVGHELAGKSLLKGAYLRTKVTLANSPSSYYNNSAERLAEAWRMTGDPEFVRSLRRDLDTALASGEEDGTLLGTFPSVASNPYPLGGMAYAMDAIVDYEKQQGRPVDRTPYTSQGGFGRPVWVVFEKQEGKAVQLDVRSVHPLWPVVLDHTGKAVEGVASEIPQDYLYRLDPSPVSWRLTVPAALPAGTYFVGSGAGGSRWEVTWSNVDRMVLYAPGGIITHSSARQWGNRLPASARGKAAWLYFQAPADGEAFELKHSGEVEIRRPDGSETTLEARSRDWSRIEVPEGQGGKLWALRAKGEFVETRGLSPFFAYDVPERYFAPDLSDAVREQLKPVTLQAAAPAGGFGLVGGRRLSIANDGVMKAPEGTVEFWVRPSWSSPDRFGLAGSGLQLLESGRWKLLLHRSGEMALTALIPGEKPKQAQEENVGIILEAGEWAHIAFQWKQEGEKLSVTIFVNGRQVYGGRDPGEGGAPEAPPMTAVAFGETILLGGKGSQSPELEISRVRFSSQRRYEADFRPDAKTATADPITTALFLLDAGTDGVNASGGAFKAEVIGN